MATEEAAEVIPIIQKVGCTESKVVRFNIKSQITNWFRNTNYTSPIFSPGYNAALKFFLELNSRGVLRLMLLPCNLSTLTAQLTPFYLDADGEKKFSLTPKKAVCVPVSSTEATECVQVSICYYSDFEETAKAASVKKNLMLFCEIEIVIDALKTLANTNVIKAPECQLVDNMQQLLESPKFSDVTINVCGQEWPAHKAILSARSRVFSAMFEHNMAEKQQNRVNAIDMEPEVFKEMLRYIYTGQAPNIETMADKLLIAADYYELEGLKLMSEEVMRANLTVEKAADTLISANRYHADQLKAQVIEFIVVNTEEVMETAGFKSMVKSEDPSLIVDVLRGTATRNSFKEPEKMEVSRDGKSPAGPWKFLKT